MILGCLMAIMAAIKKVLSPISETRITDKLATKPCRKPTSLTLMIPALVSDVGGCNIQAIKVLYIKHIKCWQIVTWTLYSLFTIHTEVITLSKLLTNVGSSFLSTGSTSPLPKYQHKKNVARKRMDRLFFILKFCTHSPVTFDKVNFF